MSSRAAHRYALSVLQLAGELKQIDIVAEDFSMLYQTLKSSRDLLLFLKSPIIKREKKKAVVKELFQSNVRPLTMNFLSLITAKGRDELLPEIIEQFVKLNEERQGILKVGVDVATPLTQNQVEQLTKHLENITKKKVQIQFKTNPTVKGGFVVRVGDTVWDASVKRQLELLWEKFVGEN
ncbi:MAG: ATP synthase F1 subunit delta [Ignavibacteriales bacterium]|nr:ATP synthase F1 subunit delta [Ignavibacteriales bacterium]